MTPSCHYTGGKLDINEENVFMYSLSKIINFCYDNLLKILLIFLLFFDQKDNREERTGNEVASSRQQPSAIRQPDEQGMVWKG